MFNEIFDQFFVTIRRMGSFREIETVCLKNTRLSDSLINYWETFQMARSPPTCTSLTFFSMFGCEYQCVCVWSVCLDCKDTFKQFSVSWNGVYVYFLEVQHYVPPLLLLFLWAQGPVWRQRSEFQRAARSYRRPTKQQRHSTQSVPVRQAIVAHTYAYTVDVTTRKYDRYSLFFKQFPTAVSNALQHAAGVPKSMWELFFGETRKGATIFSQLQKNITFYPCGALANVVYV